MAWVRLDDSALGNLKIVRLPDSALRLWLKGLCYCQMHLTDGVIPREALGPLEAKRKDVDALCHVYVPGKSALWEPVGDGFCVHDYLDYNDARAVVEQRKQKDRTRKHGAAIPSSSVVSSLASSVLDSVSDSTRNPSRLPVGNPKDFPFCSVVSLNSQKRTASITDAPDRELADRGANLLEKYAALYTQHRHGARFVPLTGPLPWQQACELCRVWDDQTLAKLITILLTTDEDWVSKTDRGWKIFVARSQWCAERLAAWEAGRRAS